MKYFCLVILATLAFSDAQTEEWPQEASGIVVQGDVFTLVGNEANEKYFLYPIKHLSVRGEKVRLADLTLQDAIVVNATDATDLESVDLIHERVVVLSEDSRKVFDSKGLVADYSDLARLKETTDKRGMEGLAIREANDGPPMLAALHELGVAQGGDANKPAPLILVHPLKSDPMTLKTDDWDAHIHSLPITPPPGWPKTGYRGTDLKWCWSEERKEWALIVLLSHTDLEHHKDRKYLQIYDVDGNPIGSPQGLVELGLPGDHIDENWEGLCWETDEYGKDFLFVVNDSKKPETTLVVRLDALSGAHRKAP